MIIPVRCFTCGKPVGHLHEKYLELLKEGKTIKEALDELGLERYCCRALMMGHIDLMDKIGKYKDF